MAGHLMPLVQTDVFGQLQTADGASLVIPNEIVEPAVEVEGAFDVVTVQNRDDFLVVDRPIVDGEDEVFHGGLFFVFADQTDPADGQARDREEGGADE